MTVYFISDDTLVKIGYTDGSARERLAALQTGNGNPLRVLAECPKWGIEKERELHQQFASDRVRGEWFNLSPDLIKLINGLNRQAFISQQPQQPSVLSKEDIACKDWYSFVWKRISYTDSLLAIRPDSEDFVKRVLDKSVDIEHWLDLGNLDPDFYCRATPDGVLLPEHYAKTGGSLESFVIQAITKARKIKSEKAEYANSLEMYRLFRRYLNPRYVKSDIWKEYRSYVKKIYGMEFIELRQDSFRCFVDSLICWAWMENQPYLNLSPNDQVLYFNAVIENPYRVKHIVEKKVGFYCSNDNAINGFFAFCREKALKGQYDKRENIVSVVK